MATKTFTQLTAVTTLAAGDELVQWNASAGAARKITVANFMASPIFTGTVSTNETFQSSAAETDTPGSGAHLRSEDNFWQVRTGANFRFVIDTFTTSSAWRESFGISRDGNVMFGTTAEIGRVTVNGEIALVDGMTAPTATSGWAKFYVDSADGDLKIIFGDGTIKTVVVDT